MKNKTSESKDFLNSDLEPTKLVASPWCNTDLISQSSTTENKESHPIQDRSTGGLLGGARGRGGGVTSIFGRKYLNTWLTNLFLVRMRTPKRKRLFLGNPRIRKMPVMIQAYKTFWQRNKNGAGPKLLADWIKKTLSGGKCGKQDFKTQQVVVHDLKQ